MGNRRKILAAVFGVLLLAVGAVSGAFLAFQPRTVADTPIANAASTVANGGSATITGTKRNGKETATFNVTNGRIYLAEIAGQRGASNQYCSGGKGYIVRGYYKATGNTVSGTIGVGGGENNSRNDSTEGGGYTSFSAINFGRSNGYTGLITGIAGGGGGSGEALLFGSDSSSNSSADGGNAGYNTGSRGSVSASGYYNGYYYGEGGAGGSQARAGNGGNYGVVGGKGEGFSGNAGSGSKGGMGARFGYRDELWICYAGSGGGGYYGGGGGSVYGIGTSGNSDDLHFTSGGGGGSSSPNTYAVGLNNTNDYGYITLYDVTPTKNPAGSTVSYPNTATIADGTAQTGGGKIEWQYSTDNATWSTTKPTQTAIGTKRVYWRYVITETNVASTECVIASGSVDLTVTKADGTVSAPTLTGNGSATYNASDIQVVTAAGQSSGTFTFATVKTKDEE